MTLEQKYAITGELDITMDQLDEFVRITETESPAEIIGVYAEIGGEYPEEGAA